MAVLVFNLRSRFQNPSFMASVCLKVVLRFAVLFLYAVIELCSFVALVLLGLIFIRVLQCSSAFGIVLFVFSLRASCALAVLV